MRITRHYRFCKVGAATPPGTVASFFRLLTRRAETFQRLQVTTRSTLGSVVYETGGVSIAHGLIRFLGSGARRSLQQTHNELGPSLEGAPDFIMIGDDSGDLDLFYRLFRQPTIPH
jgi:hypothetical protein